MIWIYLALVGFGLFTLAAVTLALWLAVIYAGRKNLRDKKK